MKAFIKVLGVIIVVFALLVAGIAKVTSSWEAPQPVSTDVDLGALLDGVYTGEYTAQPVKAVVNVTVLNGRITEIDIIEHRNGRGKKAEEIIKDVIAEQSVLVDAISGATHSSNVLLQAVADALAP